MSMYDAAIGYTKLGLSVFPLEHRGKKPLTDHGFKDASRDPDQIRKWWKKWPNANIGIATGRKSGGIYVIDLDVDDDRGIDGYHTFEDWQRENGMFPDSWIAITGRGGYHLYFKSEKAVKCHTGVLDGVDIRGDGGYVVAPPSVHSNGHEYQWEYAPEDFELKNADAQLEKLVKFAKPQERADESFKVPDKIAKGERNTMLFKAACSMQSKGFPDSSIQAAIQDMNKTRCDTPLPEDEVQTLVESALRYDKGNSDIVSDMDPDDDEPHFEYDQKGKLLQISDNIVEALSHDPEIKDSIKFNVLAYSPYICGKLPWSDEEENREWTNFDDANLWAYIEHKYKLTIRSKMQEAFDIVMSRHMYNPICDEMSDIYANRWDKKTGHIENLLSDYLGVEKNVYSVECMQLLMLGAINRAFKPGCKFDYMVVLVGPQGIGKSTFFKYLSLKPEWYNDNFNTIDGDKASEKLRGVWFAEMAELLATKRAKDVEGIKSFITSTVDAYRPPYERRTEQRKRMCVFVGTTNNEQFLTDRTGNRRFLPLVARPEYIKKSLFDDPEAVQKDFENAWGEAMSIFWQQEDEKRGYQPLTLSKEAAEYAAQMQDAFTEEDSRTGIIQEWLDEHTEVTRVCACMIYREALGYLDQTPNRKETNEILALMSNEIEGWRRVPGKNYCSGYGDVACYDRIARKRTRSSRENSASDGNDSDFMEVPEGEDLPFD